MGLEEIEGERNRRGRSDFGTEEEGGLEKREERERVEREREQASRKRGKRRRREIGSDIDVEGSTYIYNNYI